MEPDHRSGFEYEQAEAKLVEHLPELSARVAAERKWWGDEAPGAHVLYGDILNPYIVELLESENKPALKRVFDFLEELSRASDFRLRELVTVTVCEFLGTDRRRLERAKSFMGPATKRLSDAVERFWNG
jgi:hypothetical protein